MSNRDTAKIKEKTICENAEFIVNVQPIVIRCNGCLGEATLKEIEYGCPKCKSRDVAVIDGEDMYLMQLELE